MVGSLPTELNQMIISMSLAEFKALERHKVKVNLSLVCRAWRDSIDLTRDLVVVGNTNIVDLIDAIRADRIPESKTLGARSIFIKLQTHGGLAKSSAVAALLRRVPNVTHVELVTSYSGLKGGSGWHGILSPAVVEALSSLGEVEHFGFGEDRSGPRLPVLAAAQLADLASSWPNLKSLNLAGCLACDVLWPGASQGPPLAATSSLGQLQLGPTSCWFSAPTTTTRRLPQTVRSLIITDGSVYNKPSDRDRLHSNLSPFPAGVRHLAILDANGHRTRWEPITRGVHDPLIATAHAIEELEISPSATANLSSSLSHLVSLRQLRIIQGQSRCTSSLGSAEVVAFVNGPTAVTKLAISSSIFNKWSATGKREARAAARARSIQLEVV